FGEETPALDIKRSRVTDYRSSRLAEGAKPATVGYELSILRKMFNLAIADERLPSGPKITISGVDNARQVFFEPEEWALLNAELPEYLKAPFAFAYLTGWRVKSEVFSLTWDRVDLTWAKVVRRDTSKNKEGRTFPV